MSEFLPVFEDFLQHSLDNLPESHVKMAMQYALEGQGKRLRPLMVFNISGENPDNPDLLKTAAALEMVHTYSLIHDDLPAMDNDDYRRGRLTVHRRFDEATAILAGDALLTYAFELITDTALEDHQKVALIRLLAKASGASGMILGQDQDMDQSDTERALEAIYELYSNKTGELFACALGMGAVMANRPNDLEPLRQIGLKLGIAFQVQDDVLECTEDFATLGKSTESDLINEKRTAVDVLGLAMARASIETAFDQLVRDIMNLNPAYQPLAALITTMKERRK